MIFSLLVAQRLAKLLANLHNHSSMRATHDKAGCVIGLASLHQVSAPPPDCLLAAAFV
jgi:hypothetical protein